MESKIAGPLTPNQHAPDHYESEPIAIPYFDNQKLTIGFVDAKYPPYLAGADRVLLNFLALTSTDRINNSEIVHHYYAETLKFGYTQPLTILENQDIWNFVTPSEILILNDEEYDFYVCISCECEWEEEHGLQLVFKNGEILTRASGQDGHLTD